MEIVVRKGEMAAAKNCVLLSTPNVINMSTLVPALSKSRAGSSPHSSRYVVINITAGTHPYAGVRCPGSSCRSRL